MFQIIFNIIEFKVNFFIYQISNLIIHTHNNYKINL